jgi:GxxExxY protein
LTRKRERSESAKGTETAVDEQSRVAEPEGAYQFEPVSRRVIAAALAVHKQLGPGFREEIYENALCIELERQGLRNTRQTDTLVHYDGRLVGSHTLDLVVEDTVVVELKSVATLLEVHHAQLQGYLRAAGKHIGLLLNFGEHPLRIKRMVNRYDG